LEYTNKAEIQKRRFSKMRKEEMKEWLEEKKEELEGEVNEISKDFASDYDLNSSSYFCDLFTEYADSQVSIYTSDLFEWAKYNYEYIEEAVAEFGIDERNFDFLGVIKSGQYLQNTELLYQDEKEIVSLMVVNYLLENEEEIERELEESELEEMFDEIESQFDNCERLENLVDIIDEYIKIGEDEDDEE
jgi:hypothetical protein